MPKFKITVYPAKRTDRNSTEIAVTNAIRRTVVECKLDGLRAAMADAAKGLTSPLPDLPQLHVYASPDGRAPNGYKAFEAASQNEMLLDPAPAATAEPETADAA